jgi:hypothetical protein
MEGRVNRGEVQARSNPENLIRRGAGRSGRGLHSSTEINLQSSQFFLFSKIKVWAFSPLGFSELGPKIGSELPRETAP